MKFQARYLNLLALSFFSTNLMAQSSYEQSLEIINKAPSSIVSALQSAPKTYDFKSSLDQKDSVTYSGQSFRQVLIEELKSFMVEQKRGNYPGTAKDVEEAMMSFIDFNPKNSSQAPGAINGSSFFTMKAYNLNKSEATISEGFLFDDILNPGKKLLDKLAGNDNPLRRGKIYGWNNSVTTPQELLFSFVREFSLLASEGETFVVPNGNLEPQRVDLADTTIEGRNLTELTQKFLQGAVSYSQAAEDYLSTKLGAKKGLNADNTAFEPGSNYTILEHFFDEAYGYFGGARDIALYSDAQLSGGLSRDTNQDGTISLLFEKNHGLAKNFARVDLASKGNLDLSTEVSEAFIKGRHLITTKPEGYKTYVVAHAQVALGAWEKTIGAVTAIYINNMLNMYSAYGTPNYNFKMLAKFWSEMKGFSLGLQFNPEAIMSDRDFDKFHSLVSDRPALPHGTLEQVEKYKQDLKEAKDLLIKVYGFKPGTF
ncbi:MAG: DUF4856 domain-containing protein [Bacteriovoracaceae bacterium]|nr:DUF4856 domain-containing protein [Bacteriovoracaceae bacterium]